MLDFLEVCLLFTRNELIEKDTEILKVIEWKITYHENKKKKKKKKQNNLALFSLYQETETLKQILIYMAKWALENNKRFHLLV